MNIAFVCAMQDEWADDHHETIFVMVRCALCDELAVAGYVCETCGHEDVDPADQLWGHGPGKCPTPGGAAASSPAAAPPQTPARAAVTNSDSGCPGGHHNLPGAST